MVEIVRRRFLAGLVGLVAAPAVVKITSLMPISVPKFDPTNLFSLDMVELLKYQNALISNEYDTRVIYAIVYGTSHPELSKDFHDDRISSPESVYSWHEDPVRLGQHEPRIFEDVSTPVPVHYPRWLGRQR
jgi:hypothetical protein